jgi:hypothetical protein
VKVSDYQYSRFFSFFSSTVLSTPAVVRLQQQECICLPFSSRLSRVGEEGVRRRLLFCSCARLRRGFFPLEKKTHSHRRKRFLAVVRGSLPLLVVVPLERRSVADASSSSSSTCSSTASFFVLFFLLSCAFRQTKRSEELRHRQQKHALRLRPP